MMTGGKDASAASKSSKEDSKLTSAFLAADKLSVSRESDENRDDKHHEASPYSHSTSAAANHPKNSSSKKRQLAAPTSA